MHYGVEERLEVYTFGQAVRRNEDAVCVVTHCFNAFAPLFRCQPAGDDLNMMFFELLTQRVADRLGGADEAAKNDRPGAILVDEPL